MNPFYDPTISQTNYIRWWHWLFLWACPTYVAFDEMVVFYKKFHRAIYLIKMEPYPHRKEADHDR
jgi:hypothetical protein